MTATKAPPRAAPAKPAKGTADRRTDASREILAEVEEGQRAAIQAVRKFVDTVDEALPAASDRPTRRHEIVDSALVMSDRLVQVQYEFLRKVVQSASKALGRTEDGVGKA
jgi:hypothetical protein